MLVRAFRRAVLARRWLCFIVMCLSFLLFGIGTLNLINMFRLNIVLIAENGGMAFGFDIDPFRNYCLINGLDDIGLTLQHADAIREFEAKRLAEQPWLA